MSGSAANCFKNSSNDFKSSNDRIEKLKAKTIYQSAQKENGSQYKGPIFLNTGRFLGAVGGYNTNNYNLLLNVAKGRAYSESQCIKKDTGFIHIANENESCMKSVSKCTLPNSTYDLLEGPFIKQNQSSSPKNCELEKNKDLYKFNQTLISASSHPFKKLVNQDKLQNLNLHTKLPITCEKV